VLTVILSTMEPLVHHTLPYQDALLHGITNTQYVQSGIPQTMSRTMYSFFTQRVKWMVSSV